MQHSTHKDCARAMRVFEANPEKPKTRLKSDAKMVSCNLELSVRKHFSILFISFMFICFKFV